MPPHPQPGDRAGAIFITLPLAAEKRIKLLLNELADTTVSAYMMLDLFSFDLLTASWLDIQGMPAISVFESPHTGLDNFAKRSLDLVAGSMILGLIAIPMLLIALGIKITSKGPVLFRQKRYGIGGEPITVWKFRTMTGHMLSGDYVPDPRWFGQIRSKPFCLRRFLLAC